MSCERYLEAIVDHAFGADLAPAPARHLEQCEACRAWIDEQRRAIGALNDDLRNLLSIEVSGNFAPGVHARVEAPRRAPRMFWWSLASAASAAIAIVVALQSSAGGTRIQPPALPPAPSVRPVQAFAINPPLPDVPRVADAVHRVTRRRAWSVADAEVIVPPDRAEAVSRFLALSRMGTLDTSNLAVPPQPGLTIPADLAVAPLTIYPLSVHEAEISHGPVPAGRGLQ